MHITSLILSFQSQARMVLALLMLLVFGAPVVQAQPCPAITGPGQYSSGAQGGMRPTDMLGCGGLWLGNSGMACHLNPQIAACPTIRVRSLTIRDQLQLDADVPTEPGGGTPSLDKKCPNMAVGSYPDCQCPRGGRYVKASNTCTAAGAASAAGARPLSSDAVNSAASLRRDQDRMNMIAGILLLNEHYKLGLDIKANPSMAKQK